MGYKVRKEFEHLNLDENGNLKYIEEIRDLNPGSVIFVAKDGKGFATADSVENLTYPNGFEITGGIDEDGIYDFAVEKEEDSSRIEVKNLNQMLTKLGEEKFDETYVEFSDLLQKDVSQSTNISEVYDEMVRMNPDIALRLRADLRGFGSNVPGEDLALPEGFYYNEKNGITNKHNTESGMYASWDVMDLKDLDEEDLMPILEDKPREERENESFLRKIKNAIERMRGVKK